MAMALLLQATIGDSAIQPSLADPSGSSALVAAVQWVQSALLGSVANVVAVIAVAAIGFMMFRGRVDLRHGVTVIIGCFLLFGATGIAAALSDSVSDEPPSDLPVELPISPRPPLPKAQPSAAPSAYDPYAGASVPPR
jgi:type IV secretory pathway VirB2 component (pilin)